MTLFSSPSGAILSPCDRYRYVLWRTWNPQGPKVAFIGLNPSTADAERNDPTLRRCMGFATAWGYGGVVGTNLFSYRATNPEALGRVSDPIGPDTDGWLRRVCQTVVADAVESGGDASQAEALLESATQMSLDHQPFQTATPARGLVVVAWGNRGSLGQRDRAVLALLSSVVPRFYHLALTQRQQPAHPLYLRKTLCPVVYTPPQDLTKQVSLTSCD